MDWYVIVHDITMDNGQLDHRTASAHDLPDKGKTTTDTEGFRFGFPDNRCTDSDFHKPFFIFFIDIWG